MAKKPKVTLRSFAEQLALDLRNETVDGIHDRAFGKEAIMAEKETIEECKKNLAKIARLSRKEAK